MSKIIEIPIPQETINYMQAIALNVNGRKDLLTFIANQLGVDSKPFRDYEKEYLDYNAEYELAKNEFRDKYIPKELQKHQVKWTISYVTNILTMEILCDCGVKIAEDLGLIKDKEARD
jgi:hypothetical protein